MEDIDPIDKFSVGEASKVLRVSIRTLHRWDASGKLVARRNKESNHRYYTREQLEKFLKETRKLRYGRAAT